jgi:hypothetical protein
MQFYIVMEELKCKYFPGNICNNGSIKLLYQPYELLSDDFELIYPKVNVSVHCQSRMFLIYPYPAVQVQNLLLDFLLVALR